MMSRDDVYDIVHRMSRAYTTHRGKLAMNIFIGRQEAEMIEHLWPESYNPLKTGQSFFGLGVTLTHTDSHFSLYKKPDVTLRLPKE